MMVPLPTSLATNPPLMAWRVDSDRFASTWDSGIGAEQAGGRWNPIGLRTVYCALDPATAILEVAVHKGFKVLDSQPHSLTAAEITDLAAVHVVQPKNVPNPAWLHGGIPSAGQQEFGASLLMTGVFLVIPSAVSKASWNLIFAPEYCQGKYHVVRQERLIIDTRLNPPPRTR